MYKIVQYFTTSEIVKIKLNFVLNREGRYMRARPWMNQKLI